MSILISQFLLPIGFAILGSFTFWPVKSGLDFYIPIVLFIAGLAIVFVFWALFLYVTGVIVKKTKPHKKPLKISKFALVDGNTYINFFAGIRTKVTNKDLIPTNQRFLLVCNHRGNFDPMIVFEKLGRYEIAFITKPENFKIPLGGNHMWGLGCMPINRDDPLQSLEVVKNSIEMLKNNVSSVAVYPEGTRHKDCVLGEFHEGMFNIALKAEVPIVVCTISGTENVAKNFLHRLTKIKLDVIKVMPFEDFQFKTAKALSDEIHLLMDEHLKSIEA